MSRREKSTRFNRSKIVYTSLLILYFTLIGYNLFGNTEQLNQLETEIKSRFNLTEVDSPLSWKIGGKKENNLIESEFIVTIAKALNHSPWKNRLEFHGLTIMGKLDFSEIAVPGQGSDKKMIQISLVFNNCTFNDRIISNSTGFKIVFNQRLSFKECRFKSEINFKVTHFNGGLNVNGSKFFEDAIFFRCEFKGENTIMHVVFSSGLIFSKSKFFGEMNFSWVTFKGRSLFKDIETWDKTSFSNSNFLGEADFGSAEFYDKKIEFSDIRFNRSLYFIKVNKNIDENGKHAAIEFKDVYFRGHSFFRESVFENIAFCGTPSSGEQNRNNLSFFFAHADFRDAAFTKANFSGISFDTVDFSKAKFGPLSDGIGVDLKNCLYSQMTVTWQQISNADLREEDLIKLEKNFENIGSLDDACDAHYKLKNIERVNLKSPLAWTWNSISYLFGHFVMPMTIFLESLGIIFICALFYCWVELKPFEFKMEKVKKEKKGLISIIPIDTGNKTDPPPIQKEQSQRGRKALSHLKNFISAFPPALAYSFTLFFKIHLSGKYMGKNANKWVKRLAYFEWYCGYFFFIIFLYSLSRRSSILHDILSGLPAI